MTDTKKRDLYLLLGVERNATRDEIKAAYRLRALQCHPDRNPDQVEQAEAIFKEVKEAYEILSDPQRRREYDVLGETLGPIEEQAADSLEALILSVYDKLEGSPLENAVSVVRLNYQLESDKHIELRVKYKRMKRQRLEVVRRRANMGDNVFRKVGDRRLRELEIDIMKARREMAVMRALEALLQDYQPVDVLPDDPDAADHLDDDIPMLEA